MPPALALVLADPPCGQPTAGGRGYGEVSIGIAPHGHLAESVFPPALVSFSGRDETVQEVAPLFHEAAQSAMLRIPAGLVAGVEIGPLLLEQRLAGCGVADPFRRKARSRSTSSIEEACASFWS
jgi:hypothetical protein